MKGRTSLVTGEVNHESALKTLPRRLEEALVEAEPRSMLLGLTFCLRLIRYNESKQSGG
jgi:hypothetical protein